LWRRAPGRDEQRGRKELSVHKIIDSLAVVVDQEAIGEKTYLLSLRSPEIVEMARPGQFVTVQCSEDAVVDPLFRRPMTIYRVPSKGGGSSPLTPGVFQIIYQIRGRGTALLATRRPGDELRVLGPLGKGFAYDGSADMHVLVGGGTGIPGLMMLAEEIVAEHNAATMRLVLGAHGQEAVCGWRDWQQMGVNDCIATWITASTEDAQLRVELREELEKACPRGGARDASRKECAVYACGPMPMLKNISEYAKERGWACQVSIEEHMACGVGACQSCICRVKPGWPGAVADPGTVAYKLACKDGPVFDAEEVEWDAVQ
jgi:dihydroorotate dehydrogenase electron transfer subunit